MVLVQDKPGFRTTLGATVLVTGSSGLVGARLVEMLLERGAAKVICFDLAPPSHQLLGRFTTAAGGEANVNANDKRFVICAGPTEGDICNQEAVDAAFAKAPKIDVVYHIAALVGPFHDKNLYTAVNYHGTLHVMEAAKRCQVPRFVNSSSPSTRFTGADMEGLREDEMEIPTTFLALYAGSKAAAEQEVTKAATNTFMTINVAPHQVYGPHDQLFLPNLLETMGNGRLRIFGKGRNKISVCYVDNYCHGLMCGADALVPDFCGMGKFYIITDGPEQYFWDILNDAGMAMGFQDLTTKFHLPTALLMTIAYICNVVGFLIGKKLKLNPFNVKMLTIHRYFSIENAKRDLEYEPLFEFDPSWKRTIEWYKINWLPGYLERETKGCSKKSN
jgi:nucleoside-diphosphate-sugar epimerase